MLYDGTSKRVREVTVGFDVSMFFFLIKLFMIVIIKKSWMPVEVLKLCYSFISN
jgi:hypothetical protein